jgi:hypothetical protein
MPKTNNSKSAVYNLKRGEFSMAGYKERAKQRHQVLAAGDNFKLKDGENFIRVLPTPESSDGAEDDVVFEVFMHNDVGPDKRFLACGHDPVERDKGECYICDVIIPSLISKGHGETAKKLKGKWQGIFQVLHQGADQKVTGPHVWSVGGKLGRNILMMLGQGNRDYASITRGYWIFINRTGTGLLTEYSAPIPDDEPSAVAAKYGTILKPFNQLTELPMYSEQACKDAFYGRREDGADRPQSPSRRAGVLEEDAAADTPPARSARRSAPAADPEDDPEPVKPKTKVTTARTKAAEPEPEPEVADEEPEAEVQPAITTYPRLKSRCAKCGDKRHQTPDGNLCPSGHSGPPLAEGVRPTSPSKSYLKEFPEPEAADEEPEHAEDDHASVTRPAASKPAPRRPPVEPEDAAAPPAAKAGSKGASRQASLPLGEPEPADDDDPFGDD